MSSGNIKRKKRKKRKFGATEVIFMICLVVLIVSCCGLASDVIDRIRSASEIKEIQKLSPFSQGQSGIDISKNNENLEILKKINPDVVAWIYAGETNINFPVVHSTDNNYYLVHSFNKTYTDAGAIFIDCNNSPDFTDQNTVIYGHARLDGTMFSALRGYRKQDFYNEHPFITIISDSKIFYYQVFSVNALDAYYDYRTPDYGDELEGFCKELKKNSYISSNASVGNSDKILTLSTCTDVIENGRLVVFAVLLNPDGADISLDDFEI